MGCGVWVGERGEGRRGGRKRERGSRVRGGGREGGKTERSGPRTSPLGTICFVIFAGKKAAQKKKQHFSANQSNSVSLTVTQFFVPRGQIVQIQCWQNCGGCGRSDLMTRRVVRLQEHAITFACSPVCPGLEMPQRWVVNEGGRGRPDSKNVLGRVPEKCRQMFCPLTVLRIVIKFLVRPNLLSKCVRTRRWITILGTTFGDIEDSKINAGVKAWLPQASGKTKIKTTPTYDCRLQMPI